MSVGRGENAPSPEPHARRCCSTPPRLLYMISLRRTLPAVLAPSTATHESRWSSMRSFGCCRHHHRAAVHTFFFLRSAGGYGNRAANSASTAACSRLLSIRPGRAAAPSSGFESLVPRSAWCQSARSSFYIVCEPRRLRMMCAVPSAWIGVEILPWRVACGGCDVLRLKICDQVNFTRPRGRGYGTSSMRSDRPRA